MKDNIYFEDNNFKLINADSLSYLKNIQSDSIDVIFADPPYFLSNDGISCKNGKQVSVNKGEWDKIENQKDKIDWNANRIKEAKRILKKDGTIWICGTFHNIYDIGYILEKEEFKIINNITWEKPNPPPNLACRCFTNSTETILWAKKSEKSKHCFNYDVMKELNGGKQMKDVWQLTAPKKEEKLFGKHPTQKPEKLLELIIKASTNENDLILDPFCGSGTTGIVAKKLNRKFIGIDNSSEFLEISKKRYLNLKGEIKE